MGNRWSPATWARKIRFVKNGPVNEFRVMSGTSEPAMDIQCISGQKFRVEMAEETESQGAVIKTYHTIIDVSDTVIGEEVELIIEATIWNGFWSKLNWWIAIVTFGSPQEISQTILIPEDRPFKNYKLWAFPRGSNMNSPLEGKLAWTSEAGDLLNWEISNPKNDYEYRVSWDW